MFVLNLVYLNCFDSKGTTVPFHVRLLFKYMYLLVFPKGTRIPVFVLT